MTKAININYVFVYYTKLVESLDKGQNENKNHSTFIIACSWKHITTLSLCIKPTYIYIEDCKMTIYSGNHLVLIWGILIDFHFELSQCNIRHGEWLCTNAWMLLLSLLVDIYTYNIYDTFTLEFLKLDGAKDLESKEKRDYEHTILSKK